MIKKILMLPLLFISSSLLSSPYVSFTELLIRSELNPQLVRQARELAIRQALPVNILTSDRVMIDAKGIENGKVVYAVFTNMLDVYDGGYTAFFEDISAKYNLYTARIDYGNKRVIDNTGGMYEPKISPTSSTTTFLMVPDWTDDKVVLLSAFNGDVVDLNFIPTTAPQLQSPKHAIQHFNGRQILVSDQLSDVVQRFDTNGSYINIFAPAGGVNNSILDNIRGIAYRPNFNLLVTVGSGASTNTVQQFDTAGNHIAQFINTGLNSPFAILIRSVDILVSNFSGTNRISRCDLNGNYLGSLYTGSDFAGPQQIFRLPNGKLLVAAFSPPSGLAYLDSNGTFVRLLNAVTGNRAAYLLGNGRYLTTNSTGIYEIDSATGNPVRTILTGANFQYADLYIPGGFVSAGNDQTKIPSGYKLHQNYPNPFNPETVIRFEIPVNDYVKLSLYDINGREIATIFKGMKTPGLHEIEFNADGLSSGVYFCKMLASDFTGYIKLLLLK
ncbi:MAG: T9SS type A sorting domain-containing protein [Ignavibacteria bacterium]|nr:T9SS type A sorting domain-containing protein [Ignavibacteria bacterium]